MPLPSEMLRETQSKLNEINRTPGCVTATAGCLLGIGLFSCSGVSCFLLRPDIITNPVNLPYIVAIAVLGGIGGAFFALHHQRVEKGALEETENNIIGSIRRGGLFGALIERESKGAGKKAHLN